MQGLEVSLGINILAFGVDLEQFLRPTQLFTKILKCSARSGTLRKLKALSNKHAFVSYIIFCVESGAHDIAIGEKENSSNAP